MYLCGMEKFNELADKILSETTLSENTKQAIKKLATSKFNVDGITEERAMAIGLVHGYSLCLKENSLSMDENVQELIRCGQEIYKYVGGARVLTNNDTLFNRLSMAVIAFEPKVLTFDYDLEKVLTNTIEFCRGLEKEKEGDGFKALFDLAPATKIFDAVTLCLKDLNAKYEFSEYKSDGHCENKGCYNNKIEGGKLCKKCQQDHDDLPF